MRDIGHWLHNSHYGPPTLVADVAVAEGFGGVMIIRPLAVYLLCAVHWSCPPLTAIILSLLLYTLQSFFLFSLFLFFISSFLPFSVYPLFPTFFIPFLFRSFFILFSFISFSSIFYLIFSNFSSSFLLSVTIIIKSMLVRCGK